MSGWTALVLVVVASLAIGLAFGTPTAEGPPGDLERALGISSTWSEIIPKR